MATSSSKALKIIDPTTNRPIMYHRPPSAAASSRRSSRSGVSSAEVRSVSPASSMSAGAQTNAGYPGMFSIPVMNGGVVAAPRGADAGAGGKAGVPNVAAGGGGSGVVNYSTPKPPMQQQQQQQQQHQVMHQAQAAANAASTVNRAAPIPGSTAYAGYGNPLAAMGGGVSMGQAGTTATFSSGVIPANTAMPYSVPLGVNGVAAAAATPSTASGAVPQATHGQPQPQFMRRLDTTAANNAAAMSNAANANATSSAAVLAQQVSSVMPAASFNQYQQHAYSAMTPGLMAYPQAAMVSGSPYMASGLTARTLPPMPPGMSAAASSTAVMLTPEAAAAAVAMYPTSYRANSGFVVAPASHDSTSSGANQAFAQALSNSQMQQIQAGQFIASQQQQQQQQLGQSQHVNSTTGVQPVSTESGVTLQHYRQQQQQMQQQQPPQQPVSSYVSRQFASAGTLPTYVGTAHPSANPQNTQQQQSAYSGSDVSSTASAYVNQMTPGQTSSHEALGYAQFQQALAAQYNVTSPNAMTSLQAYYGTSGPVSASYLLPLNSAMATQQQATVNPMGSTVQTHGAVPSGQAPSVTNQQPQPATLATSTVPQQSVPQQQPPSAGAVPLSKLDGEAEAAAAAKTTRPKLKSTDDYLRYWRTEIQEYIKLLEQNSQVNLILRMRFIVDRLKLWFKEAEQTGMHSKDAEFVCRRSMHTLGYDWDTQELYKKTYKHDFVQSLKKMDSAFGDLLTGKSQSAPASNPAAVSHQPPIPDKEPIKIAADGNTSDNGLLKGDERHRLRDSNPSIEKQGEGELPKQQPSDANAKTRKQERAPAASERLSHKLKDDEPVDTSGMSSSSLRLAIASLPRTDWGANENMPVANHDSSRERRSGSSRFSQQTSSRKDAKLDSHSNRRAAGSRRAPSQSPPGGNRSHSTSTAGDRDKHRENVRERSSSRASTMSNQSGAGGSSRPYDRRPRAESRTGQRFPTDRFPLPRARRPSQSSQSSERSAGHSQRPVSSYREKGADSRDRRASVSDAVSGGSIGRRGGRGRAEPDWRRTPRFSSRPVKVTPLQQSAATRHSSLTRSATSTDIYRAPRRRSPPKSNDSRSSSTSASRHQFRQSRSNDDRPLRDHRRPHDANRTGGAAAQARGSQAKPSSSSSTDQQPSSSAAGRGDSLPRETNRGGHRSRSSRGGGGGGRGRRGRGGSGSGAGRGHSARGNSGPGRGGGSGSGGTDRRPAASEKSSSRSRSKGGADSRWQRKA